MPTAVTPEQTNVVFIKQKNQCPIGQTTAGEGSTNISDCQYGDDTEICDGDGTHCVTLNSVLSGASAEAWESMP